MVGQVGYYCCREGHHAAGNEAIGDCEGEEAGQVVGEAPQVDYQGGKEAAGYHNGHSPDTKIHIAVAFTSVNARERECVYMGSLTDNRKYGGIVPICQPVWK